MLLKLKNEYSNGAIMILDNGHYCTINSYMGEKVIFTKLSNKTKVFEFSDKSASYINILYKEKAGWINQKYVEDL